jgi:hypothetical protein
VPKVKVDSQKGKTSSQTGDLVCVQRNPLYFTIHLHDFSLLQSVTPGNTPNSISDERSDDNKRLRQINKSLFWGAELEFVTPCSSQTSMMQHTCKTEAATLKFWN